MPSCNLAETVHSKWDHQAGKDVTCLYQATVLDLIRAFSQTTAYRAWLKGGRSGKGPDKAQLCLRTAQRLGDPKMIAKAVSSYPDVHDLLTRPKGLEGAESFGSTKRKLDMPPGSSQDSHRYDKVNYSIPQMSTRSTRARIQESLSDPGTGVQHTTSVLETNCNESMWHIARLKRGSGRKCQALQAQTNRKCDSRVASGSTGTPAPTFSGKKTEYHTKKIVEAEFWFCADDVNRCVKGNKKPWMSGWPPVPTTWPVKMGTNLTRQEVAALEDAGFQLQQRGTMSPRRQFQSSADMPLLRSDFPVPDHPDHHLTLRNNYSIRRNPDAPTAEHRNKWDSAALMNGCFVTGVTAIPYPGFGCVVSLDTGKNNVYLITLCDLPSCTCPDFLKMISAALGKRGQWVNCKHIYYIFRYVCKMDYKEDTFLHAPSFSYNEVLNVLESAGVF